MKIIDNSYQSEVAVVVPISRMAGKLKNLNSWLDLAPTDWQIFLIHDYRDEETSKELKTLVSDDRKNIQISEGKFGNPGAARNSVLCDISSRWTIFWDSDDFGDVKLISEWVNSNRHTTTELAVFQYNKQSYYSGTVEAPKLNWSNSLQENLVIWGNEPGIWRCLIRSEKIVGIRFPHISMGEDQVFLSLVASRCKAIEFINEISYTYIIENPQQLTNSKYPLSDLIQARRLLPQKLRFENQEIGIFVRTVYWRMTGTIFFHSNLLGKILFAHQSVIRLIHNPKEFLQLLRIFRIRFSE